jgi:hypothetical protein
VLPQQIYAYLSAARNTYDANRTTLVNAWYENATTRQTYLEIREDAKSMGIHFIEGPKEKCNHALSICQGLSADSRPKQCENENCSATESVNWHTFMSDATIVFLCDQCFNFRTNKTATSRLENPRDRTKEDVVRMQVVTMNQELECWHCEGEYAEDAMTVGGARKVTYCAEIDEALCLSCNASLLRSSLPYLKEHWEDLDLKCERCNRRKVGGGSGSPKQVRLYVENPRRSAPLQTMRCKR